MSVTAITINAQSRSLIKNENVKVWGNCDMCQARIEKAAKEAGAASAKWDGETGMLAVSYNPSKTSINNIEQKIASVGHDTKAIQANDEAYNKLHDCCKYERALSMQAASASCCKGTEKCSADGCCKPGADKTCGKAGEVKGACCTIGKSCCSKS